MALFHLPMPEKYNNENRNIKMKKESARVNQYAQLSVKKNSLTFPGFSYLFLKTTYISGFQGFADSVQTW